MYRQQQKKAKECVIRGLNNNQDGLKFDIDTSDSDSIVIICHSQKESVRIIIGETKVPDYILKCIQHMLIPLKDDIIGYEWAFVARYLIKDVFKIYGVDVKTSIDCAKYQIMNTHSYIYGGFNTKTNCDDIITAFRETHFDILLNELVGRRSLLILLDPLQYFYCCSLVIQSSNLCFCHTEGIYELFLKKFPEQSDALFRDYLMLPFIFEHYCKDIMFLVFIKMLDLWVPSLNKN